MKGFLMKKIKKNGMLTVSEYMDLSLYHPQRGYYMRMQKKIGDKGDYITSSKISPVFAKMLVQYALSQWNKKDLDYRFCEIGSGDGTFAHQFLTQLKELSPEVYNKLTYYLIEKSPFHRTLIEKNVNFHSMVLLDDLKKINSFSGIVFSNEWLDALPVHVIEKKHGSLFEIMISVKEHQLIETSIPLTNKKIISFLEEYDLNLGNGQRIEIPLKMIESYRQLVHSIQNGTVITIDYGYLESEWKQPYLKKGSLRGYKDHRIQENYLASPGEMDLTSHIHFDVLKQLGEKNGFHSILLEDQRTFLENLGIYKELLNCTDMDPFSYERKWNRGIMQLMDGGGVSSRFKVLVQERIIRK
ncbi:class I SAM-dependent methyltransferase [Falsibacillus albus]|uniref:SAM-dependent methyltransferase n=1 Tax=Falsibacillus albus TaxID=2478915 RepID=A0A3L7K831_9BACI|nr:SAM-dependent methyltransferase [Falsibacillus albus]RLQ98241.1 SAM-dependent methyltransferase [Falsibacillus albus]